ncbi:MAG TPA: M13 family metallopeptidase [Terriglobales bacterium]|nr:M13 family metallopeptidase [Terriglobales bacterium]
MRAVKLLLPALLVVFACTLMLQASGRQKAAGAKAAQATPDAPTQAPGFDEAAMDKTADPCTDFYQYACGGWLKQHPIPDDRSRWSRFDELQQRNFDILHDILEKASADRPGRTPLQAKIGDYYASCMDEAAINQKGLAPLKPVLDRIEGMKSKSDLADTVALLHSNGIRAFFRYSSTPDFKNASQMIAEVDQGGLGLPERDYYFKTDPKSVEIRDKYVQHVAAMLKLAGESDAQAAADAKSVMDIETALAKASMKRVDRREPTNIYHKMSNQELEQLAPGFAWNRYLTGVASPPISSLNVAVPDFVKGVEAVVASTDLEAIKAYLRWHVLDDSAAWMPTAFVDEDFNFSEKTLNGTPQQLPRWKRCVQRTDRAMGELLGQPYVEQTFGKAGKERTLRMVQAIEAAMRDDIQSLPWMSEATKKAALAKLQAVANKIGYPDKWRDYSTLTIVRGDGMGNRQRASAFAFRRDLNKIGKALDKTEWGMSPPTVNAYYNPLENNINFPAGILQPPFFYNNDDDALNLGAAGTVVGHELSHGFDDQGRKFDADGNLRDWWTESDGKEFEKRAACIVDEYGSFSPVEGVNLNGKLTLGENTADNGGLRLAYMAMQKLYAGKKKDTRYGFTPEQRFFLGFGQEWCEAVRPERARVLAQIDPHSPGRFRATGVLRNMPEFGAAFNCKKGTPMQPEKQCRVW